VFDSNKYVNKSNSTNCKCTCCDRKKEVNQLPHLRIPQWCLAEWGWGTV